MTVAADELICAWRERYADELAAATGNRERATAWWLRHDQGALLERDDRGEWQQTEAGFAFAELFWETTSEALTEEVIAASEEAGEVGCCTPVTRNSLPAAAFYWALGVTDAARMPGHLGDFLLTSDEAATRLPEIEGLLAGPRREELIERASRWLALAADGSKYDGAQMVDGVVRVFRRAAEQGLGVAAVSAFF